MEILKTLKRYSADPNGSGRANFKLKLTSGTGFAAAFLIDRLSWFWYISSFYRMKINRLSLFFSQEFSKIEIDSIVWFVSNPNSWISVNLREITKISLSFSFIFDSKNLNLSDEFLALTTNIRHVLKKSTLSSLKCYVNILKWEYRNRYIVFLALIGTQVL